LAEETGIHVVDLDRFRPEPDAVVCPCRFTKAIHVFSVMLSRREFDARLPHDDEVLQVQLVEWGEIARMIKTGELYVSTPAALLARKML
jgi:hypothetical protein